MLSDNMKISLITVCYNSEKTIRDTIESVMKQTYKDYEYIIVDGQSNDSTLDIINEYKDIILISEKDKGLYDAMNKGIKKATGDIIGILNSDDILYDENVFRDIVDNFDEDTQILYGDVKYYNEDFSEVIRDYISGEKKNNAWCPAHPTMYIRKEVFEKIGLYDLRYRIVSDYDFIVRCNVNNIRYKYLRQYLVKMRYGGVSNGLKGYLINFRECCMVLIKNRVPFPVLHTIGRSIHTIRQLLTS